MSHKLPDGWTSQSLGKLFEFKNGFNADKTMYGRGKKFINVMEVINNHCLREKDIPGQVDMSEDNFALYSVVKGDVLFNRTSETPEEIGLTAVYLDNEPVTFGGFVIRARPTGDDLDQEFCKYCFLSSGVRKEIIKRGQGAIRANIGQGDLSDVCLQIPSKDEQKKIAKILSTWDEAIEKLEKVIKQKKIQKKSFERNHFFNQAPLKTIAFGDLFERVNKKNGNLESGNVLTISARNGLISQRDFFKKSVASKNTANYYLLKKGDFAYNKSYSSGYPLGAIKPLELYEHGIVSPLYICFCLKENNSCRVSFYKHFFESGAFDLQISSIAQEGARNHGLLNVSVVDFFSLKVPNYSDIQIEKLSILFDSVNKELLLYQKYLGGLKLQKQGLMQQLLTGKKRVIA